MNPVEYLQQSLVLGGLLFGIGLVGFLVRRNLIVVFLSLEMMLQGVSVSLVAWSRYLNDWGGQMLVIFIITVAACEAGIALILILLLCKHSGTLDVTFWQRVREEGVAPYVDSEIPQIERHQEIWPPLTPAGVEPPTDPQERMYRSHV